MKKIFPFKFLVFGLALACILSGCTHKSNTSPQTTKSSDQVVKKEEKGLSRLSTTKNRIVDESGNPYIIKGISTHGLAWFPEILNQNSFDHFKNDFKLNTVRLALYTAENSGYCTDGNKEQLEQTLEKGIKLCQENEMYCVIDWHILSDQDPLDHVSESKEFFEKMAKQYGSSPNIIFEICNEPNGNTTWQDVCEYANQIIPIIRKYSDNLILVGTPNWSQNIDQAAQAPLDYENVAYTLHFYAATHKDDLRAKYKAVVDQIPIVVSEFGICDASGNGNIDEESANAWIQLLDQYDTGRILWNASNKDEASSILKPGTDMTNWTLDDLSASGKWLLSQNKEHAQDQKQEEKAAKTNDPVTVSKVNEWQKDGKQETQIAVTVTALQDISTWTVNLEFDQPVQIIDHWNCNTQANKNQILLTAMDYNTNLKKDQTLNDIGLIVRTDQKMDLSQIKAHLK